jgi:hypothetical protein
MVELQNDDVFLAAVNATVREKVLDRPTSIRSALPGRLRE